MMGGVQETPVDISVFGPEIYREKESRNQGKNKVKEVVGEAKSQLGGCCDGSGLEKTCLSVEPFQNWK